MEIRTFVTDNLPKASLYASIHSLKNRLFKYSAVLLYDEGECHGVLSVKDVVINNKLLAVDCLTEKPSLDIGSTVHEAIDLMLSTSKEVLKVKECDRLVGVLTRNALVQHVIRFGKETNLEELDSAISLLGITSNNGIPPIGKLAEYAVNQNNLLRSLSHDLRSPLNRVGGLIEVIEMEEDIDQKLQYLELIKSNIKGMLGLVDDLYDLSLNGITERVFDLKVWDVSKMIAKQVESYRFDASKKRISIIFELSGSDYTVLLDIREFLRALDNLVSNAIKFTPIGRKIIIRLSEQPNESISLMIKDEGIGIPKNKLNTIFEPMNGLNRAGTNGEKSIGLGLSITKQILDKMGMLLEIKSDSNKGTEVGIIMRKAKNVVTQPLKTRFKA